jgi:hypothetical protein
MTPNAPSGAVKIAAWPYASGAIYHGVPEVLEGTAPEGLGLPPGRVSITLRETGL